MFLRCLCNRHFCSLLESFSICGRHLDESLHQDAWVLLGCDVEHFLQRLVKAAVLPFWTAIVTPLASLAVEADSCARWEPWHFGSPLGDSGGRCGRSADGSAPHGWNSPDTPVIQTWRRSFAAFAGNDCRSRSATSYLTKTLRPPASGGFIKASIQTFCLS